MDAMAQVSQQLVQHLSVVAQMVYNIFMVSLLWAEYMATQMLLSH